MSLQPFSRVTSSRTEVNTPPDGSLPPHMAHLRRKRRDRPTDRQRERKALAVGEVRRNDTVALVRSLTMPARKRGGARYGQAPDKPPHERMQAPKPMKSVVREQIYLAGRGLAGLTPRQHRQYCRMALLHDDGNVARSPWSKGRATPKRKASR